MKNAFTPRDPSVICVGEMDTAERVRIVAYVPIPVVTAVRRVPGHSATWEIILPHVSANPDVQAVCYAEIIEPVDQIIRVIWPGVLRSPGIPAVISPHDMMKMRKIIISAKQPALACVCKPDIDQEPVAVPDAQVLPGQPAIAGSHDHLVPVAGKPSVHRVGERHPGIGGQDACRYEVPACTPVGGEQHL